MSFVLGEFEFTIPIILWTLIALAAAAVSFVNLNHAKQDRAAVRRLGGYRMAARVLTADGIVRRDQLRVLTFIAWALLGFLAAYVGLESTQRGTFIVIGLTMTAALQLYSGYMDRQERFELLAEIDSTIVPATFENDQLER